MARNILLSLRGDPSDAQKAVRDLAQDLRSFSRETATAELKVDAAKAREEIAATKRAIKDLPSEGSFTLDLQIAGAEAKIDLIKKRLASLASQDVTPQVEVRLGLAAAQLEAMQRKLSELNDRKVNVDVQVSGFDELRVKLDATKASLDVFAARKYEGKIGLDITAALAKLALLRHEVDLASSGGAGARPLHDLEQGFEDVVVLVEKAGEETAGFFSRLADSASQIGPKVVAGVGSALSGVVQVAAKLSTLGPASILALAGLLTAVPLVGGEIIGLVAALGSLLAVMASAALGAGFLGIALAGALAPVLGVVIAVVAAITNIVKVNNAAATAAQAVTSALATQRNARETLDQATKAEAASAIDAEVAKRNAVLAVRDAYLQVQQAQLGIQDAKLAVDDAKQALADFYTQVGTTTGALFAKFQNVDAGKIPGLLDGLVSSGKTTADTALQYAHLVENLKTAQVGQETAANSLTHATVAQSDAQATANKFATQGLTAYAPYAAAIVATTKAQQSLADATEKLGVAQDKALKAGDVNKLSASESKFGELFRKIRADLGTLFAPAEDKVFGGLDVALEDLEKLAANPAIQKGLTAIGSAIGGVFKELGAAVSTKSAASSFSELEQGGAKLVSTLGKPLPALLSTVLKIATIALPDLLSEAGKIAGGFEGFLKGQQRAGVLRHEIDQGVKSLKELAGLVGSASKLLYDFFGNGVKSGQDLLTTATHFLDKLDRIVNTAKGQQSLHDFFSKSVDSVRTLYHLMVDIFTVLKSFSDAANVLLHPVKALTNDSHHGVSPGDLTAIGAGGLVGFSVGGPIGAAVGAGGVAAAIGISKLFGAADGGIATRATVGIWGEAGDEALVPLRPDILGAIGRSIATATPSFGGDSSGGSDGRRGAVRDVHIHGPGEQWPGLGHALAVLGQRLDAIGA